MNYKYAIQIGDVVTVKITNISSTNETLISGEVDSVSVGLGGPDSRKISVLGVGGYIYLDDNTQIEKIS